MNEPLLMKLYTFVAPVDVHEGKKICLKNIKENKSREMITLAIWLTVFPVITWKLFKHLGSHLTYLCFGKIVCIELKRMDFKRDFVNLNSKLP